MLAIWSRHIKGYPSPGYGIRKDEDWGACSMRVRSRTLLDLRALPLADAGAARVGEHGAADLVEDLDQAVALDGRADLLATGRDREGHLRAPRQAAASAQSAHFADLTIQHLALN